MLCCAVLYCAVLSCAVLCVCLCLYLIRYELAAHEGVADGPKLSIQDLVSDGFEQSPAWFFVLIAELDGQVAGYALCNRAYSSWTGRAVYVEDLWVSERHRRRGVARALLRALCERCAAEQVTRLDWHVLEDNAPALALYARLGARDLYRSERRLALRLDEPCILAVAAGHLLPSTPPQSGAHIFPRFD
ncbi:thialysine N-epsilon-acetyltransferase isoform X2 [Bombyx mori]|uniref:thialysine N-epsilon-acetyltransferase isoform X2 n=1 Tax=Bombyx mori TaxID=7091 RepID=UPI002ED2A401